jgi:uncharacterized YigZ family protein
MEKDEFFTIAKPGKGIYKEKGSKFYGFAFPAKNEEEVKKKLEEIKSEYHDARHHCYAYRLGPDGNDFRMNDDGEPSSTAGKPIYGQIMANELTNVLIIVVRYFGGTKLGTSGLIRAYKTSADEAISDTKIVRKTVKELYNLIFDYTLMSDIDRLLHDEKIEPVDKNFKAQCTFTIGVRLSEKERIINRFGKLKELNISKLNKRIYS